MRNILKALIAIMILAPLVHPIVSLDSTPVRASIEQPANRMPTVMTGINDYRASRHLPPVALDEQLDTSAQLKAQDIVDKGYWSHVAPDGTTPWDFFKRSGYRYRTAGENLAKCFTDGESVVKAWIASPAHEAVLTGDYKDVGIGVAHNSRNGCDYVVAHFGSR